MRKDCVFDPSDRPATAIPTAGATSKGGSIMNTCGSWLLLVSTLMLSGCSAVQVHLGMKVYLAKIPVTSMQASLPKGPGIGPGEKSPLVVSFTGPDGKLLQTEGAGHGKIMWKDLQVTATVATVNAKGMV